MPLDLLLPFLVASALVTVIPGADMALVTRQVLVGGPALAQRTIFGNLTGLLVHGAALAAGLSALLVASTTAYTAVTLASAAYLVYLGVQALVASTHPPSGAPSAAISRTPPRLPGGTGQHRPQSEAGALPDVPAAVRRP